MIPTYNAGKDLQRLIDSIRSQTVQSEILVVDSQSQDGTADIANSCKVERVIRIKRDEFNHGKTRNYAVQQSAEDVVVFFTQDALLCDERCVERLTEPLERADVAASYGRQVPREDAKPTEQFARLFNYPESPAVKGLEHVPEMGIKTFFFSNVFSAVRRREFEKLGMFPENIIMFEDMIYAAKLIVNGYRIAYVPEAKVMHSHNYSLAEQFKRYFYAGASFKQQPWFLQYAESGKEGRLYIRQQIRYLLKENRYPWILYALCEAFCKYCGYYLGLHYGRIPAGLPQGRI